MGLGRAAVVSHVPRSTFALPRVIRWCRGSAGRWGKRMWVGGGIPVVSRERWGDGVGGCGLGAAFRWCRSFLAQPPATGRHPCGMRGGSGESGWVEGDGCRRGCRNVVLRMGDPLSVRVEYTRDWPDGLVGGVPPRGDVGRGFGVFRAAEGAVIAKEFWNILQIRLGRILWAVSGHIP